MAQIANEKLDRLTITLPKSLVAEVEGRIAAGHYATTTEWIRHAIREQLRREKGPMQLMIEEDTRIAESLDQARKGETKDINLDGMINARR